MDSHEPYALSTRTRGYEVDRSRTLAVHTLLSYLEDLRWAWMQHPEVGLGGGLEGGGFFVVRDQVLEQVRRVGSHRQVTVLGVLEHVGRVEARVRHAVIDEHGALLARARVRGVWLGADRRPARIPDEARAYARDQQPAVRLLDALDAARPAPMARASAFPRSLVHPPEIVHLARPLEVSPPTDAPATAWRGALRARPSDTDAFNHVNASAWVRLAEDARADAVAAGALGEHPAVARPAARVAVSYDREALAGEPLQAAVFTLDEPGAVGVLLGDGDGAWRCRVRFDGAEVDVHPEATYSRAAD